MKKKIEKERKERERNEELKLERRIQEQRERMQKEFEDEMTRRREQAEKKVQEGSNNNDDTNDDGTTENRYAEKHGKVSSSTLVPHSPPVPALRDRGHKKSGNLSDSPQETEVIGNSGHAFQYCNHSMCSSAQELQKVTRHEKGRTGIGK